jgi:TPR repeat protein
MEEAAIEAINRLSADQITRRLSGPRTEVAAFVREAAEAGSAEARARFAQMLLDGDGVEKDEAAALGLFELAARAGHLEAANMVGRCHDLGWGTPIDKSTAAAWYKRAAERGLIWAKYNYATLLALGQGVPQDRVLALALFREAAEAGNAKAINFVGSFHEDGWMVERDMDEAARCYALAAEGGDFRGAFNHGRMLAAQGDDAGALLWFGRAWAGGNPRFRSQMAAWLGERPEPYASAAESMICD